MTSINRTGDQFRVIHTNPVGEMPAAFFGNGVASLEEAKAAAEKSWAYGRSVEWVQGTDLNVWTMRLIELPPPPVVTQTGMNAMETYFHSRGIVPQLEADESPEAVIWPVTPDEAAIRRLGEALREWASTHAEVRRILGLKRMLDGKRPQVAAGLLGFPLSTDSQSWIEEVALVVVSSGLWNPKLDASLGQVIAQIGSARVTSYIQYCYENG